MADEDAQLDELGVRQVGAQDVPRLGRDPALLVQFVRGSQQPALLDGEGLQSERLETQSLELRVAEAELARDEHVLVPLVGRVAVGGGAQYQPLTLPATP